MTIDEWAAQASTDPCADGETQEEYEARIAKLRELSAENARKHEWSHHRRPLPKDFICLKCQHGDHQHRCLLYGCTCKAPTTDRQTRRQKV